LTLAPWMYVVLLGLVCLAYAQLLPRQEKTVPSGDMIKELEQSMELFASDMEEQNETLLQLFSDTKREYEAHLAKLSARLEQLEKQNHQLVQELIRPKHPQPEPGPLMMPEPDRSEPAPALGSGAASESAAAKAEPDVEEQAEAGDRKSAWPTQRQPLLMNVRERYAELFRLYGQKKSVEYIAKKLGMNKGEVQLIIQLARQEEKTLV
jgi:uncharacterized membrane-anchored protein YhcB (DUF1043 family)